MKIAVTQRLFMACLLIPSSAQGQAVTKPDDNRSALIERKIANFVASGAAPGVSVTIVDGGKVIMSVANGMADLENSVHATPHTLYRLASLSKTLTGTAAAKLWEDGKLDLDAPVQRYCPQFPLKPWPVTTRELLNHTAGIRGYRVDETPYSTSERDPEVGNIIHYPDGINAGLALFQSDPLIAEPGSKFNYSTHGYTVVGCVIQGASGERYADYVRKHVLLPAGMSETILDDRLAIIPQRTRFYSKDRSGTVINAEPLDSSYKLPGGGWLSSAADMGRFEEALLADRIIARKTRDTMWTPPMLKGSSRSTYGFGWGVGINIVEHGGLQQGSSEEILIAPRLRSGVVVLTNSDAAAARGLADEIMAILSMRPWQVRGILAVQAAAAHAAHLAHETALHLAAARAHHTR